MADELIRTDERVLKTIYKVFQDKLIELGYAVDTSIYPDPYTAADVQDYNSKVQDIITTKGYQVRLFGESAERRKGRKDAPKIVIFQNRTFIGDIGAPMNTVLMQDKNDASKYAKGFLAPSSSNIVVAIHLISATSKQEWLLNSIINDVLSNRTYLAFYDIPAEEEKQVFFIEQTSFSDLNDWDEGTIEKAYFYTVKDLYLTGITTVEQGIAAINEIKVEQHLENSTDPDDTLIVE